MQILEILPRRLTLEDRPWVLGIILAVVILFLLFLALATSGQSLWLTFAMLLMAALFGAAFVAFVRRVINLFINPTPAIRGPMFGLASLGAIRPGF
jgi:small-conductance mechanosensitive channel